MVVLGALGSRKGPVLGVHGGVCSLSYHKLLTRERKGVMLKAAEVWPEHVLPPTECSLHSQVKGQPGEACAEAD